MFFLVQSHDSPWTFTTKWLSLNSDAFTVQRAFTGVVKDQSVTSSSKTIMVPAVDNLNPLCPPLNGGHLNNF